MAVTIHTVQAAIAASAQNLVARGRPLVDLRAGAPARGLAVFLAGFGAEHLPGAARPAMYIRKIGTRGIAEPWDPRFPIPAGYVQVDAGEAARAVGGAGFRAPTTKPVVVRPVAPPPRERKPPRRRARRSRAAEAARRAALGLAPIPPRISRSPRSPRPPRPARRPRAARRARRPRRTRVPRAPRRPGTKGHIPGGFCKLSDATGGCWNVGTCGPSPSGASTGPRETVGHCIFEASPDCASCAAGSCGRTAAGLIRSMLARLPAGWRADPAHRERAEEALRTRAAKRRRRFTRLPEEVPGLVVETAPAAARHAAGTCGCQRAGPGFNANALVPWTCAVDPLVRSGHATGTPVCPEGVSP